MLKIVNRKVSNKYNGTIVLTDEQASKIEQVFNSKFEAFCYGIEKGWTKKSIMKYCLNTERDQYFHNYLLKYEASKK